MAWTWNKVILHTIWVDCTGWVFAVLCLTNAHTVTSWWHSVIEEQRWFSLIGKIQCIWITSLQVATLGSPYWVKKISNYWVCNSECRWSVTSFERCYITPPLSPFNPHICCRGNCRDSWEKPHHFLLMASGRQLEIYPACPQSTSCELSSPLGPPPSLKETSEIWRSAVGVRWRMGPAAIYKPVADIRKWWISFSNNSESGPSFKEARKPSHALFCTWSKQVDVIRYINGNCFYSIIQ